MMRDFDMDKFLHDNYVTISYESQPIGPNKIVLYLTTFDMERYEKEQILEKKVERVEIDTSIAPIKNGLISSMYDYDDYSSLRQRFDLLDFEEQLSRVVAEYYDQKVMELQNKIDEYNSRLEMQCHARDIVNNITNTDQVSCDVVQGNVVNCNSVFCREIRGNAINCNVRKM